MEYGLIRRMLSDLDRSCCDPCKAGELVRSATTVRLSLEPIFFYTRGNFYMWRLLCDDKANLTVECIIIDNGNILHSHVEYCPL